MTPSPILNDNFYTPIVLETLHLGRAGQLFDTHIAGHGRLLLHGLGLRLILGLNRLGLVLGLLGHDFVEGSQALHGRVPPGILGKLYTIIVVKQALDLVVSLLSLEQI